MQGEDLAAPSPSVWLVTVLTLAAISRSKDEIQQVAESVCNAGSRGLGLVCDVSDPDQVAQTIKTVDERFGAVDILVNNAGITKREATVNFRRQDLQELIGINFEGAFHCCQAVGKIMLRRRQGNIINISSLSGLMGMGRGNAVYSATKGALFAMTRELACEWGPYGIRVNALAPYWFRTKMIGPLLENQPLMARILESIPLGRIGEPEDLIGPVVFLASAASALITGQVLVIDGGMSTTFMAPKSALPAELE